MAYTDFSLKKFTSIYDRFATEMNKCIEKTEIPEWIIKGKTTLIPPKKSSKEPPQTAIDA